LLADECVSALLTWEASGAGVVSSAGDGTEIVSACNNFSLANRSRSRASFCALVTTVIFIFFISPASLSTSSPDFTFDEAAAPAADIACDAAPFAGAAAFFGALGARGTGSFLAGALVFFTFSVPSLGPATLIEVSGLFVASVSELPRTGTIRVAGGAESALSEDITVDAALRRRAGRGCFPDAEFGLRD